MQVAEEGRRPRFSPDGSLIAYWTGLTWYAPSALAVYVVPSAGGESRELAQGRSPIWMPDGKHVLFAAGSDDEAWWIASVDSDPEKIGAARLFKEHNLSPIPGEDILLPDSFDENSSSVLFSALSGDGVNVWKVRLDPGTWELAGAPKRLTAGTSTEIGGVRTVNGEIVFASIAENYDVWALPLSANRGQPTGAVERLTRTTADDFHPSISRDGTKLAFRSVQSGRSSVRLMDLESQREWGLNADSEGATTSVVISPDGTKVAYDMGRRSQILGIPFQGGLPQTFCDRCSPVDDWSPDGRHILSGTLSNIGLLQTSDGSVKTIIDTEQAVFDARFSPDGLWIAFHQVVDPMRRRLFITPFSGDSAGSQGQWIAITDGKRLEGRAAWSPDGNLLYFISDRDGSRCIWAQPLDPKSKHPVGDAFEVYGLHDPRRSLMRRALFGDVGLSVARDRLVFSMDEISGNIWMLEPRK